MDKQTDDSPFREQNQEKMDGKKVNSKNIEFKELTPDFSVSQVFFS